MSTPCTTYLVLPCPPSYGPVETSQQRIVSRRARCPLGLADYRHNPDGWAEAGLVNASGLTPEEREAARAGAVVLFKAARKSHPTSPHGTFYRWAKPYGRVFKPRVATADMLRAAGLA